MKKFSTFCDRYHVADAFPATEGLLCSFAASMADQGLSGGRKEHAISLRPARSKRAVVVANPLTVCCVAFFG